MSANTSNTNISQLVFFPNLQFWVKHRVMWNEFICRNNSLTLQSQTFKGTITLILVVDLKLDKTDESSLCIKNLRSYTNISHLHFYSEIFTCSNNFFLLLTSEFDILSKYFDFWSKNFDSMSQCWALLFKKKGLFISKFDFLFNFDFKVQFFFALFLIVLTFHVKIWLLVRNFFFVSQHLTLVSVLIL